MSMRSMGSIWKATLRAMAPLIGRVSLKGNYGASNGKGVGDVLRPPPGCGEHHVEGDVVAGEVRVPGEPILRGPDDAPLLGGYHPGRVLRGLPPLHLDEGEPLALERHKIDLAHRGLVASRDD